MKKVIILLLTRKNNPEFEMAENVIRKTWANNHNPNCEIWYYYGDNPEFEVEGNVIKCEYPEGFANIGKKTICAFEYLLNTEFDFLLRANSSSYVNIDNLVEYVQNLPTKNYYGGSPIHFHGGGIRDEDTINPPSKCAHGCGFLLSRDLVEMIVEKKEMWNHHMIDDMALCRFMKNNNIELTEYPRIEVSRFENEIMFDQHDTEIPESSILNNFFVRTRTRTMDRTNEVKIIEKCYSIENYSNPKNKTNLSNPDKQLTEVEKKFYDTNLVETVFDEFKIRTLRDDGIGRDIQIKKTWEPHMLKFMKRNLKNNDVFVDVGSNYGWFGLNFHKSCKFVYSFEPQNLIYQIQKENLLINNINNVKLFNFALGNESKKINMSPINYEQNGLNIGDLSIGSGGEETQQIRLDDIGLDYVSYIKIDVQGFEKFVILGAENTIKKNKPTLIVEFENFHLTKFGYDSKELFELIKSYGYYPFLLDYFYPSDHVFIHLSKLEEFKKINSNFIAPLNDTNNLNFNLENGVTEKII